MIKLKLLMLGSGVLAGSLILGLVAWPAAGGRSEADPKAGVSASQQAALAAGDVDAAYAVAADLVLNCLGERGVPEPKLASAADGSAQFSWAGADSRETAQSYGEIYKECYFEFMDDVDRAWQTSDAAELAAAARGQAVLACVKEKHPEIRFASTPEELMPQLAKIDQLPGNPLSLCIATVGGGSNQIKFAPPTN